MKRSELASDERNLLEAIYDNEKREELTQIVSQYGDIELLRSLLVFARRLLDKENAEKMAQA